MKESMEAQARQAQIQKANQRIMLTSFVPPAYLPCTTSVAQLKAIEIKDLKLETHHRGTYLILRAITPPHRLSALLVMTENDQGEAVLLIMYQHHAEESRAATDFVNMGTILLVKEPFYKTTANGTKLLDELLLNTDQH